MELATDTDLPDPSAHRTSARTGLGRWCAALIAATAALLVVALGAPAQAHVRVTGTDVSQGGYGVLTFRVPTESDTASTTAVTVTFPEDTPITSVSTQPVPGWTATVKQGKLAKPVQGADGPITDYVESVTWTADSAATAIKPGEFQQFPVSAGPFPEAASIAFPALQTYSDGSTVNWNEQSATGGAEPEHPAPTLELPKAADDSAAAVADETAPSVSTADSVASTPDGASSWPGWVGLVAGLLALVVAVAAFARGRARSGS